MRSFIYVKALHIFKIEYYERTSVITVMDENNIIIMQRHGMTLKQFEEMCKLERKKVIEELL